MSPSTPNLKGLSRQEKLALLARLAAEKKAKAAKPRLAPLSFAQQSLWFLDQLGQGSTVNNIFKAWFLNGPLDEDLLEAAVNDIVARHDGLRATFGETNGVTEQLIAPKLEIKIAREDLRHLPEEARSKAIRERCHEAVHQVFDLSKGPLLRASLIRVEDECSALFLGIHHIVADGLSLGLFFKELSVFYGQRVKGEKPNLPRLAIQYSDYARWQHEKQDLNDELAYWRKELEGADQVLEIPGDRSRPAVSTQAGAAVSFAWPECTAVGLDELARQTGSTTFMVLLAAFDMLIYRYTRRTDFLVSTPIANRGRPELEPLIGIFANLLVLRNTLSPNMTFREFLNNTRERCLGAFDHQDLPFGLLVEELQPERDLSRYPLIQVEFAFLNATATGNLTLADLEVKPVTVGRDLSKVDLTLEIFRGVDGLAGYFEYASDLYDRQTIARMIVHLQNLVHSIIENPDQKITGLNMIDAEERNLVLHELNHTDVIPPDRQAISELFEKQVARTPDALALIDENGDKLTYAELNAAANRMARFLRHIGSGNDARVGILSERSLSAITAMFGILKSGGAYVPLDPAYPEERLEYIAEDAGINIMFTRADLTNLLPHVDARRICLDSEWNTLCGDKSTLSGENPNYTIHPDQSAYVIFTSGSTGRPKGVMISHAALVSQSAAVGVAFKLVPEDRCLQFYALSFDVSVEETYPTLITGATLVLRQSGRVPSFAEFGAYIEKWGITVVNLPTPYWHEWVSDLAQGGPFADCLRLVVTGTEAALPERLNTWVQIMRDRGREDLRWINAFGNTETTISATCWETGTEMVDITAMPIGRSITTAYIYVLDKALNPQPVGVIGELYMGGPNLARGYMDKPALTASKFRPDPFTGQPGTRIYATGDMAKFQRDGNLLFLGREDNQVKIRGFRIETGEIEVVLQEHPAVQTALVLAVEVAPGSRLLAAYVVPEQTVDVETLRTHLVDRLPAYMVPSGFVVLDEFPMTAAGKIDRRALPEPPWTTHKVEVDNEQQQTSPEMEVLMGIWCDILGLEKVGIHQNFFDLGGHSLLAIRVLAQIQRVMGVAPPLRVLFSDPTLAGLAEWMEKARLEELGLELPEIKPVPRGESLPLSFGQQRFWFFDQLDPGSPAYNMPGVWKIKGHVDADALERAVRHITNRHEGLRTAFRSERGQPRLVLVELEGPLVERIDLSGEDNPHEVAERLGREKSLLPFNLEEAPLFRVSLLKLGESDYCLILIMHHIVSDGWSFDLFLREMLTLEETYRQGGESQFEDLPVQVADFAQWQRDWLQGKALDIQLDYWKKSLAGVPELLELPTDKPRPKLQTTPGARCPVTIPAELGIALRRLSRGGGATLYMTMLASFGALLHRYARQQDILIGSPIAGRRTGDLEGLIGLFVNTLIFRIGFAQRPGFARLIELTRDVALGAYSHQDLPFEQLVDSVGVSRHLSHNPLFQAFFVLHHAPVITGKRGKLALTAMSVDNHTSRFDITLSLMDRGEAMTGFFEYNSDLFTAATIERMSRHFVNLLQAAVAEPERPIDDLPMSGPEERTLLLETWNATQKEISHQVTADCLFRAQVLRMPEAEALVFAGQKRTYAELNQRVETLTAHLKAMGVGPDKLVGIALERERDLVACLLATWRAGGAYVPMDPNYPAQRLTWMLEDSDLTVLITRKDLAERLPLGDGQSVLLLDDMPETPSVSGDATPVSPDNMAYMIYTSGSTGRPKGVQISHHCLVNFLETMAEKPGLNETDTLLSVTTVSFDIAGLELYLPLIRGARLWLVDGATAGDAKLLAQALDSAEATVMQATPATWRVLLEGGWNGRGGLKMLCGGEALDEETARRLVPRGAGLWNMYGPTETTIWSAIRDLGGEQLDLAGVTLGYPIGNTTIHVVDGNGRLAPIGLAGELLIGGFGLSRGYRNRPAMTAEKFVPDPFASQAGSRLYRTGDLVSRLGDGDLRFQGRIDHQLKIRGFRIEPGEIEAALGKHPRVAQAVVVARGSSEIIRLVAYISGGDGPAGSEALSSARSVRTYLRDFIPEYMQPSDVVFLENLPLTPNGKVDRAALPEPETGRASLESEYVAPTNSTEEQLVEIWSKVLGKDQIGIHDDFFELGGHSLLATQVIARITEIFDVDVLLRVLFEKPTIAGLAGEIISQEVGDADDELLARLLAEMGEDDLQSDDNKEQQ